MKHSILFHLSLILLCAYPASAFWDNLKGSDSKDTGTWNKLVSDAKKHLKKAEQDQGNRNTPTWGNITTSANEAIEQFSKDGKGFDVMRRAVKKTQRSIQRLSADENSTLTGRFYDLKQPIAENARPLSKHTVVSFIKEFMDAGWDSSKLEQYYSPEVELAAPYFYLPRCKASYAPEAFDCNEGDQKKHVRPLDWVVHYTGTVTAPESGTYRFVGMGDDTIVVRFNKRLVLESGWSIPTSNHMTLGTTRAYQQNITSPALGRALYQYQSTPHWNSVLGGIASGTTFKVEKGKQYPIELLISEIPGNEFGFCLFIEKIEGKAPNGQFSPAESPTLALFRTNDTLPDLEEIKDELKKNGRNYTVGNTLEIPPFANDSPIWVATAADESEKRTLIERTAATLSDEETAMGRRKEAKKKKNADNSRGKKVKK